jgi:hypothetical protein
MSQRMTLGVVFALAAIMALGGYYFGALGLLLLLMVPITNEKPTSSRSGYPSLSSKQLRCLP